MDKGIIRFRDRKHAGEMLAQELQKYAGPDTIILALPRGGVVVGFEVAKALRAPLNVFLVRKLGAPGNQELAAGAIASGGIQVLEHETIDAYKISERTLSEIIEREKEELERRSKAYWGEEPFPELKNKTVIIVDDGIGTGSTMRAAILALRQKEPRRIVAAVPVGPSSMERDIPKVDDIICLLTPKNYKGVGQGYEKFFSTPDEEVRELLKKAKNYQLTDQWTKDAMGRLF